MGFYNIVLEGEQAEAYKRKKKAEAAAKEKEDEARFNRRYGNFVDKGIDDKGNPTEIPGNQYTPQRFSKGTTGHNGPSDLAKGIAKDAERFEKAADIMERDPGTIKKFSSIEHMTPASAQRKYDLSKKETEAMRTMYKYAGSGETPSEDEMKQMKKPIKKIIRKSGLMDDMDAVNRHIRRHPEKYAESGIFESVEFLND